ncbi:MAG: class I SAM-dependent methyltransferase [bacterium]
MSTAILEHVPCNLCNADEAVVIYPGQTNGSSGVKANEIRASGDEPLQQPLVKCGACGFEYVTPRLNSKMVLDGYTIAVDETFVSQAKGRELTFKRCLAVVQEAWQQKPGRILDVGTANGSFLKVAKDAGWQVDGCEPNRWMCDWCKKNYGIDIKQGTIFDMACADEIFDVVTLWDVLEHTPDPMATIRECMRVLNPGGLLVVNYPDIGSWISRLMGRKWVFLLSVHYYYFTRRTIREALAKAGLEMVLLKPHFQRLQFDYILLRATPYIGVLGKAARSAVNFCKLGKLQIPYWMGQTLAVARKKGS